MGSSLLGKLNAIVGPDRGLQTVGIGDGGNELGLGSLHAEICKAVPLGPQIGCVVPSDAPLVASVSNWGGFALTCALAVLSWDEQGHGDDGMTPTEHLDRMVLSRSTAERVHLAMNAAGALDGITAAADGSVDGMPLSAQLDVLDELRAIALDAMSSADDRS